MGILDSLFVVPLIKPAVRAKNSIEEVEKLVLNNAEALGDEYDISIIGADSDAFSSLSEMDSHIVENTSGDKTINDSTDVIMGNIVSYDNIEP